MSRTEVMLLQKKKGQKKWKGRKSKAINKRNETVGMKGGTQKGYKMAQGTHIGGNKRSFMYSYFYILCYLPSKHPMAFFLGWGWEE